MYQKNEAAQPQVSGTRALETLQQAGQFLMRRSWQFLPESRSQEFSKRAFSRRCRSQPASFDFGKKGFPVTEKLLKLQFMVSIFISLR